MFLTITDSREEREQFYSGKHKNYCVKFETAVCIATGMIVWVAGPFYGPENDVTIIHYSGFFDLPRLWHEVTYADKMYASKELKEKCIVTPIKGTHLSEKEKAFNQYVRRRRVQADRTNGRIKNFECLHQKWRHSHLHLKSFFTVICCIVNLELSVRPEPYYLALK